jgi:hypothetical protein
MEDVRKDVLEQLTAAYRDAIEKVGSRLHVPPISDMSFHEIINTFWNEFNVFQNGTNPYHDQSHWASHDVMMGNSYLRQKKNSILYTTVLEYVTCHVTSKLCGIGPAERSWGRAKQIKDSKRSHLSGESTEK